MAVASRLEGSVVSEVLRKGPNAEAPIRIGMPSGILTVAATVGQKGGAWHAEQGAFYRTQRRMFEGQVLVRASGVPGMIAAGTRKVA
jgi:2-methylaconitate cis-trans-isomerase PrpF